MLTLKIFNKTFFYALLLVLLADAISYASYFNSSWNSIMFFMIIGTTLILALWKLELGVYVILAELLIGSKGYLFSFNWTNTEISLRLGLFAAVVIAWLAGVVFKKRQFLIKTPFNKIYLALIAVLAWGVLNGLLKHNNLSNLFFDLNGWLFYGMFFVFITALNSWKKIETSLQVIIAAGCAVLLKTIILLYVFSHNIEFIMPSLYKWVRVTGVGEITKMPSNYYRIFFQSHIYELFLFFIAAFLVIGVGKKYLGKKEYYGLWVTGIISGIIVFISYSRSFWLAAAFSMVLLYYSVFFLLNISKKKAFTVAVVIPALLVVMYAAVLIIVKFPYPESNVTISGSLLEDRTKNIDTEAGAASRFQLLKPLANKIMENPVLGSGFGTTVTYKTSDPRFLSVHPDGIYTTYIFEWSYLDIMVKMGAVGFVVCLLLLFLMLRYSIKLYKKYENDFLAQAVILALVNGILILTTVNITTPYLNHPLGLGLLMFIAASLTVLGNNKKAELK